jgi:hypothetical protein
MTAAVCCIASFGTGRPGPRCHASLDFLCPHLARPRLGAADTFSSTSEFRVRPNYAVHISDNDVLSNNIRGASILTEP